PHPLLVPLGQIGVRAVVACPTGDDPRAERALEHGHVEALDRGDALDVRVDEVGKAAQALRPPGDAERGPLRECALPSRDGELYLCFAAPGDLREHLSADRRAILEAIVARDAPPADVVVGRDFHAGDQRGRAHAANSVELASTITPPPSTTTTPP